MKTTAEMIEVMQAFEDGKTIECLPEHSKQWVDVRSVCWNWSRFDYRIKPEPVTCWVVFNGLGRIVTGNAYNNLKSAENLAKELTRDDGGENPPYRVVKMVEAE